MCSHNNFIVPLEHGERRGSDSSVRRRALTPPAPRSGSPQSPRSGCPRSARGSSLPTHTKHPSRRGQTSTIGMICAALAAIFAIGGGTIYLASAARSSKRSDQGNASTGSSVGRMMRQTSSQTPSASSAQAEGLIIHTHLGDIRIEFTPELSGDESIEYITNVIEATEGHKCEKCNFYRVEDQQFMQGDISDSSVPPNTVLGQCPTGELVNYEPKRNCPDDDPHCACHGPIMSRGMVGWAGGKGGPEFFINTSNTPSNWWNYLHTVWGIVRDEESLRVAESVYGLPIDVKRTMMSGMRMLEQDVEFSLELYY